MEWKFTEDTPIYLQIMEQVKMQIANGNLKPGDKMLPVRELAFEAEVNPNTMQKALSELERDGFLYSQRTTGRFVSDNVQKMESLQGELVQKQIEYFLENMRSLGHEPKESCSLLERYCKKDNRAEIEAQK